MFTYEDINSHGVLESYLNFSSIIGTDEPEYYGEASEGFKDVLKVIGKAIMTALTWIKNQFLRLFGQAKNMLHVAAIDAIKDISTFVQEAFTKARKAQASKNEDEISTVLNRVETISGEMETTYRNAIDKILSSKKTVMYRKYTDYRNILSTLESNQKDVDIWLSTDSVSSNPGLNSIFVQLKNIF